MRRATKRRSAYTEEAAPSAEIVPLRNEPEQRVFPGDRVTIGGMQEFKVVSVEWSSGWGDYFVHGRFGPCKFYMLQKDVRRVT